MCRPTLLQHHGTICLVHIPQAPELEPHVYLSLSLSTQPQFDEGIVTRRLRHSADPSSLKSAMRKSYLGQANMLSRGQILGYVCCATLESRCPGMGCSLLLSIRR